METLGLTVGCVNFSLVPILAKSLRDECLTCGGREGFAASPRVDRPEKRAFLSTEEIKPFPTVERRRTAGAPPEARQAGEVAVFQELGKALTSSLQLDQVLRTILEKIDEFLRPDHWSLLLLDEAKQE